MCQAQVVELYLVHWANSNFCQENSMSLLLFFEKDHTLLADCLVEVCPMAGRQVGGGYNRKKMRTPRLRQCRERRGLILERR